MKSGRAFEQSIPAPLLQQLIELRSENPDSNYIFASPATKGHVTPNALLKILKRIDPDLTSHGFRNAIKEFCRKVVPPVPDSIADAYCDHGLRWLDASYRRMDTSAERAVLAERLCRFIMFGDDGSAENVSER